MSTRPVLRAWCALHCGQAEQFSQDCLAMKSSKKIPTLDLHGYKTDDVYDAVESFLARHQTANTVRIMPGKGTGKVKAEVLDYLNKANYPWSYERLPDGRSNEGVLVIYME